MRNIDKTKVKKLKDIAQLRNFNKLPAQNGEVVKKFYEFDKIMSKNVNVIVYEARQILTNQKVAIKVMKKLPSEIKKIKKEIQILKLFRG